MKKGKIMKKIMRSAAGLLTAMVVSVCGLMGYYSVKLPDSYYVKKGESLKLETKFEIDAVSDSALASFAGNTYPATETAKLRLFGFLPVKDVEINTVETPVLIPGGEAFGIKLLMDGVMVVGMGEIKTERGMECPAEECGIKEGDVILSLDGKEILSNNDIQEIVSESKGRPLEVVYTHDGNEKSSELKPVFSIADSGYKAGIWVRDSTAGIGTITFYDPSTNRFGGLGHPVCDSDTGEIVPISGGETAEVNITDVVKGYSGKPGELHGSFKSEKSTGRIYTNNKYGIFGEMFSGKGSKAAVPMGMKQEIKTGAATIYTTIDENGSREFQISIEKIDYKNSGTKNMTIKVTDPELLQKTGGIVQGMSGSPIMQDGKIIGAVTHVLVSDPQKGYGIFCENMYGPGMANG